MAIATPLDLNEPLVIAAGCKRAGRKINGGYQPTWDARMTDTDFPGKAAGTRADQTNVATEIHETMLKAPGRTYVCCAVGRVFLANTAKVEFHTRRLELQPGLIPSDLIKTDPGQQLGNRVWAGKFTGRKIPCFAQQA